VRLLTPILLLIALLAIALWLDRPLPRADLVIANTAEALSLDPQRLSHQHDVRTARGLFEGLTEIDGSTGEAIPAAAERWERSDDGRAWTFHLRPGLRWSDGSPLTTRDFIAAWRRVLLPDQASDFSGFLMEIRGARAFFAWRSESLKRFAESGGGEEGAQQLWKETLARFDAQVGLRAPDDRTLVVELERPIAYWLDLCAFPTLFPVPEALVRRCTRVDPSTGIATLDPAWTKPGNLVGNGPYRLASWRPKRAIRLERNPHFHGADAVRADSVDIVLIEDPNTAVLAFESGAIDWLTDTLVEYRGDMFEQARAGARRDLHVLDAFGTDFFSFNCRPRLADGRANPFANPAVRRAFALAVDKRAIVERITRLGETVASTLVPPRSISGYALPAGLPLDRDRARAEFAEAGWSMRDGVPVNEAGEPFPTVEILYASNSPRYRDMSAALADMWTRTLGVPCALRPRDARGFRDALKRGDFMVARGGWYGDYRDPTTWLDLSRTADGNNDRGYSNPAFDALLDRAADELDPARRLATLSEAERLLVERDLPILPICHYVTVYMFDPEDLDGISRDPRLEQYLGRIARTARPAPTGP
jgi:oligopeptide transport system substrate-binding protein